MQQVEVFGWHAHETPDRPRIKSIQLGKSNVSSSLAYAGLHLLFDLLARGRACGMAGVVGEVQLSFCWSVQDAGSLLDQATTEADQTASVSEIRQLHGSLQS